MQYFRLFTFLTILALPSISIAQDADEDAQKPRLDVVERAKEISEGLDQTQRRHFNVMYGNYNLIQVVEDVRDHIEMAVDKCGDENPDMEEAMDTRFEAWEDAVEPLIDEAEANVNNMIVAQDYMKPRDIRNFFDDIEDAREKQNDAVKKVPVTSAEACQTLLEKMDETQANMVRLLEATLISLPRAMQAQDDEERAEAEAKRQAEEDAAKAKAEEEAAQAEAEAEAEEASDEEEADN